MPSGAYARAEQAHLARNGRAVKIPVLLCLRACEGHQGAPVRGQARGCLWPTNATHMYVPPTPSVSAARGPTGPRRRPGTDQADVNVSGADAAVRVLHKQLGLDELFHPEDDAILAAQADARPARSQASRGGKKSRGARGGGALKVGAAAASRPRRRRARRASFSERALGAGGGGLTRCSRRPWRRTRLGTRARRARTSSPTSRTAAGAPPSDAPKAQRASLRVSGVVGGRWASQGRRRGEKDAAVWAAAGVCVRRAAAPPWPATYAGAQRRHPEPIWPRLV